MEQQRLEQYIKSYQQLLYENGYGEADLKSGKPDGTLKEMVHDGFHQMVKAGPGFGATLNIFGIFGPKHETIIIAFRFEYDHEKQTIDLQNISFESKGEKGLVLPLLNSALLTSQQLYDSILDYRAKKNNVKTKRSPSNRNRHGL